jgi:hypothetical protein
MSRTVRRLGFLAIAIGVFAVAGAGVAAAQVYPPTAGCGVQLSASSIGPGGAITISGTDAPPGAPLTLVFESTPVVIGTTTADASGNFVVQTTIPADAAPGRHTIRVEGATGCAAEVFVPGGNSAAGPARARTSGSLAFTGWNAMTILVAGLVALTVGVLLVTAQRRRAGVLSRSPAPAPLVGRPRG